MRVIPDPNRDGSELGAPRRLRDCQPTRSTRLRARPGTIKSNRWYTLSKEGLWLVSFRSIPTVYTVIHTCRLQRMGRYDVLFERGYSTCGDNSAHETELRGSRRRDGVTKPGKYCDVSLSI